jgi:hypothetical protein
MGKPEKRKSLSVNFTAQTTADLPTLPYKLHAGKVAALTLGIKDESGREAQHAPSEISDEQLRAHARQIAVFQTADERETEIFDLLKALRQLGSDAAEFAQQFLAMTAQTERLSKQFEALNQEGVVIQRSEKSVDPHNNN